MKIVYSSCRAVLSLRAFCLMAAVALSGCATKNPLMDDKPVSVSSENVAIVSKKNAAAQPAAAGVSTEKVTGLKRFFGMFTPYRVDLPQGNFVSHEMLAALKEGMTPEQVRFVLGTPLVTDIFHADRWDYLFRLQKGNGEIITSRVTLNFKENKLANIDAGDLPNEADYLALIAGTKVPKPLPKFAPTDSAPPSK